MKKAARYCVHVRQYSHAISHHNSILEQTSAFASHDCALCFKDLYNTMELIDDETEEQRSEL